jgi:hypothetical protein
MKGIMWELHYERSNADSSNMGRATTWKDWQCEKSDNMKGATMHEKWQHEWQHERSSVKGATQEEQCEIKN